jgi:hypothetical protein
MCQYSISFLFLHREKLALFYHLSAIEVCINFEKYVIHWMNFMSNLIILSYSGGGGREMHDTFKGGRKL